MQFYHLASANVFRVEGRDATRYLNARLTNDIKKLAINSSLSAAALSAQGKIESFVRVYKSSEEKYFLVSDGGDTETQHKALSKFIVADRVTITIMSGELGVIHRIDDSFNSVLPEHEIEYAARRIGVPGIDSLVPKESILTKMQELSEKGQMISDDAYHLLRVFSKTPQFGEDFFDSMLFSEFLIPEAISFTKGCYVGQEVVEKIDSHGEAPRVLVPCTTASQRMIAKGHKILNKYDEKTGEIISWYHHNGREGGFARVRNEPPFENLHTEAADIIPLE